MKIDILAYTQMTPDAYLNMLKNLHVKQVKQIYDVIRRSRDRMVDYSFNGEDKALFKQIEVLRNLTKSVYDTLEHVPNKQESKAIRQALQKQKKSR